MPPPYIHGVLQAGILLAMDLPLAADKGQPMGSRSPACISLPNGGGGTNVLPSSSHKALKLCGWGGWGCLRPPSTQEPGRESDFVGSCALSQDVASGPKWPRQRSRSCKHPYLKCFIGQKKAFDRCIVYPNVFLVS